MSKFVKRCGVASPGPDDRYRLYIDESGDHVFRKLDDPAHRFLCLLGCWFRGREYRQFHNELETFKTKHIPHSPDDPVVLHRKDIMNCRGAFWRLRDMAARSAFDRDLLELVSKARFLMTAVVIDKAQLQRRYETPAHPYHLALGFLLQRYCGLLNHRNRQGDVLAESRGAREDTALANSYEWVYRNGAWQQKAIFFQRALTSKKLKLKPKKANIAGLQLADILARNVCQAILIEEQLTEKQLPNFAAQLINAVESKFNRHLYDGRVSGYGKVLFPK